MMRFALGVAAGVIVGSCAVALARPFPDVADQLDVNGDCAVNFPGDTIMHARLALSLADGTPLPTALPLCIAHYASPTDTPTAGP